MCEAACGSFYVTIGTYRAAEGSERACSICERQILSVTEYTIHFLLEQARDL